MSAESRAQHHKYLDFGSLDSSAPPDLSLNSLHQPKLSLQLDSTDLSFSLPDITTCSAPTQSNQPTSSSRSNQPSDHSLKLSQQLAYDLNRHPSKRWTSFSELGKSVLRLKSFERSTVHGSSPCLRPRLSQVKPASIYSTSTTTSASNHRNLFKLFHPDHPINPSTESVQSNPISTLPILPPLSELFDGSTSFDKELSSITNHPTTVEEPIETYQSSSGPNNLSSSLIQSPSELKSSKHDQNGLHLKSQSQSIVSSQSSPIITSVSPLPPPQKTSNSPTTSNPNHQQVEKSVVNQEGLESSPPAAILIIEEPAIKSTIDQGVVSEIPTTHQPAQTEDNKADTTDDDQVTTSNKSPLIEILNRSDESKSNEDLTTTSKLLNLPTNTKTFQNNSKIGSGSGGLLGKKKKFSSESSSFFKLLFLKGLGHLKSSHSSSVHNDTSKTLVPTSTIHNH